MGGDPGRRARKITWPLLDKICRSTLAPTRQDFDDDHTGEGPPITGSNDICLCFCFVLVCGAFAIQVQELPDYPDHCHVPAPKLLPAPTSPPPPPPNLNTEIPRYREVDGYDRTLSDGVIYGVDATSLGVILTVYFVGCK